MRLPASTPRWSGWRAAASTTRAVRALLRRYPTPTALRQAGRRRVVALVTKHAPRMGARLADEVLAAVASQTVAMPAEATHGRVIAALAGELDQLHARRDQLAAELAEAFLAHPLGPVLVTLPAVGPRCSSQGHCLLSESLPVRQGKAERKGGSRGAS